MKIVKRIALLTLALIMSLALTVPVFAEQQVCGSIIVEGATLTNPADYTTYSVYKMFTVEDGNDTSENKYKVDADWKAFVAQSNMETYFTLSETTNGDYVIWAKNTTSTADAAAIAELARAYVDGKKTAGTPLTSVGEVTVNGNALDVYANGYYLLVSDNNTASGVIVVKNGDEVKVTEKSVAPGMPTIEKLIYEDSTQAYNVSNTVDVGSASTYKVTITAGQGASHYILHDSMDEHIKFDANTVAITRGGNTVLPSEYEVVTDENQLCKDCTFHIKFDESWCNSLNEGAVIVVTYKGTLIGDKVGEIYEEVDTNTDHENTAWLTHTSANVKSDESTVSTRTYEVNVVKQDQDNDPLKGAGFVLRDNENNYYKYDNKTGIVSWVTNIDDATEYFSDENGKLRFYGVDAEIFHLVEKTVPGGYTGVESTQVSTKEGNVEDGDVIIKNTLGQKLPETGGIGTTVFYIGGAALVLCALATLIVIKRKEKNSNN